MPLSAIDTNLIVALRALLREQNVTRAGKAIGLSQSAMSHALRRLRAHFGDPLLVQAGHGSTLTVLATALIEPVNQALAELERVFSLRTEFDPAHSDRVFRVVAPDNLELYLLPAVMKLLARQAPGISVRVEHLGARWEQALQTGGVDLKLGRKYKIGAGLRSQTLFEERLICAVARGHASARRPMTVAQYAALRHLLITPTAEQDQPLATPIDAHLARHGYRRRIALSVPHFAVAPFIVAGSDLALTASERLLRPFAENLGLQLLPLPFARPAYRLTQVWAERQHVDPGHRWFRGVVARAAGL
ncbi:MAG: LysR family transcriptional regulator [Polyangia bacterium]|jgi:DNA-binding transcriptional LysR family regulator